MLDDPEAINFKADRSAVTIGQKNDVVRSQIRENLRTNPIFP